MLSKKAIRLLILFCVDIAIVICSDMVPLVLRFGVFDIPAGYLHLVCSCIPVDIAIVFFAMAVFRLYNRIWTYAGIDEVISCFFASILAAVAIVAYHSIFDLGLPRSFYVLNWFSLFFLMTASRTSIRILKQFRKKHRGEKDYRRVMLVGAGSAGSMLIRELMYGSGTSKILCLVDDNPNKRGKYINGIQIVGNRNDIPYAVSKYDIDEIIITIPSASPAEIREIIEICQQTNARIKRLPSIARSATSNLSGIVRDVNYEDLLGREEVVIQEPRLANFIAGKTIMVTGGGGSIGSELCRQIKFNSPKRLIIVDIYENGAYELQMDLKRHYPGAEIHVIIASVRDYERMEQIFRTYRPDVIYHAAAHKHVPLMEVAPNEAVTNNCLGTLNVVRLADRYQTDRFILISTDKAVRPTNVMGATKRICEMIVQTYDKRSAHTRYAAVRFGNVLGSNGSVIPLFLREIEEGGPVTLTHENITRFFMTIKEAVSLVLQAGLMAGGGEIFVLDMGEPVRIYDLAEKLIKLKGYTPGQDIRIEIVGLRPGEKLYEELLMAEEGLRSTENKLIYIGKPIEMDCKKFLTGLEDLIAEAEKNSPHIREKLQQVCDTYQPKQPDVQTGQAAAAD